MATRNTLGVTLLGESGTGKELFAHAIHAASQRRDGPFVAVNCGSIPAELVVAELFGYEAGTFTGGRSDGNAGRFEDASGGTIFLDEVSDLSGPAQTALLRVLQEREVVRLGGSAPRRVDVRVIAATNRPLLDEIRARRFRRDLYYRLNVLSIEIPPLRERADDVAELARNFLAEAQAELGCEGLVLGAEALAALRAHRWPGNVRELRNVILRSVATVRSGEIRPGDLLLQEEAEQPEVPERRTTADDAVSESGRDSLLAALEACGWVFSRAASRLGDLAHDALPAAGPPRHRAHAPRARLRRSDEAPCEILLVTARSRSARNRIRRPPAQGWPPAFQAGRPGASATARPRSRMNCPCCTMPRRSQDGS